MHRSFLITGATKGIGLALAHRLAAAGHQVIGVARSASAFPGPLHTLDLATRDGAEGLAGLAERYAIDGLINNVGLVEPGPIGAIAPETLEAVLSLTLQPALAATQAALPGMKARHWGRIVNITSLTVLGSVERTVYAAAKAALTSFTRSWALELAPETITVNAVAPGPTETELFRANNPPGSAGEARYLAGVPMRRLGQPSDIAAAIAFLLSEDAGFITGQTLHVDGGASIGKASFI